jgi:nucleoside-diphosphate-sugar epimerase
MATWFVTGGTGLIGSNVVRLLRDQGEGVKALVRAGSPTDELTAIGVEVFEGDVQSADDLLRGSEGCDLIVNSAALLGGASQDMNESLRTNADGSAHAYDAARAHGIRCVTLSSTPFLDQSVTLTEEASVADLADWADDPYTQSKGAAYVEAKRRAAEDGDDIVIVIPGGTYGPGLVVSRAMAASSYNRVLRGAINAKLNDYVTFPVPWVFAADVAAACIAAGRRGATGRTYLAFGAEDAQSTAAFLNVALEVAGQDRRIAEVAIDPADPGAEARYGATLVKLASRTYPVPWFDNSATRAELGYSPRSLREGLELTVPWLRDNGQIT